MIQAARMEKFNPTLPTLLSTIVVDSWATTHMLNNRSSFFMCTPTAGEIVQLANNLDTPVMGYG